MGYLCIYTQNGFTYNGEDCFEEEKDYLLGKEAPGFQPDICLEPEIDTMSKKHGKITSCYGHLYYTEFFNKIPTRFNNAPITDETFPISLSDNIPDIFSFMEYNSENAATGFYPAAFMFLSRERDNWDVYHIQSEFFTIGGSSFHDYLVLPDTPHEFLTFIYMEAKDNYYLKVSKEAKDNFVMITDDNLVVPVTENMELDFSVTYRFVYANKYMFIIGGPVILYATI